MVCLSSRFLCLAALVAAAATPSYVVQVDARALGLAARHHDTKSSSVSHSNSSSASKAKGKLAVIPLPPSANGKTKEGLTLKKHRKSGKKNEKRAADASKDNTWDPLDPLLQIGKFEIGDGRNSSYSDTHHLLNGILAREADPDHHHHHHHHDRRDEEAQAAFSLRKRAVSRIYGKQVLVQRNLTMEASTSVNAFDMSDPVLKIGKYEVGDGRHGSASESHQSLADGVANEKRSPHHHHHGKVIVNGDDDHVHVNRRSPHHHYSHHHDKVIVNGDHDDVHVHERRAPHHHHDHHGHDKVVVNGDDDDVHVHERRNPHHHHHHDHDGHDRVVVNGDNDNVHVHERNNGPSGAGVQLGAECGVDCSDDTSFEQKKRSDAVDDAPGVPGTVDIVNVGGPVREKLASLILSSFPNNSTTNSSSLFNSTKSTADPDASPFILDASNTTKTQFFLVVKDAPIDSASPSASLADTIAALKVAASTKSAKEDPQTADIKVTLQVPVFEPSQAAMRPYCATYDPNPPTPAPLTMEKCTPEIDASSNHKSQTFAYNPITGIVRPMWFGVTPPAGANLTDSSSNVTDANSSTNSSSGPSDKQMNFKIPTSMKNAPIAMPGPASNATQTVNGTAPSLPVGAPTPPPTVSPQNVTLVFTPVGPAVHEIGSPFDAASFEPAGSDASADSGSDDDDTEDVDSVSSGMSMSSGSSTAISTDSTMGTAVADSSNAATATDSNDSNDATQSGVKADVQPTTTSTGVTSNATDMMSAGATSSGSGSVAPSPTMSVDEAAIEKMYQQGPHVL